MVGPMDFLGHAATFTRIVESGSFSAAARSLRLSLPAVSRQLASLEAELGAALCVRTTRRMQITEAGQRFYEHAKALLRDAELARASVKPERGVSGSFVLSASVSLGLLRVVPALPTLLAAHPALALSLRLEDRASDLVREGIDLVLRAGMALPDSAELMAHPLATFGAALVASPSYLKRAGTPREARALGRHAAVLGPDSPEHIRFSEQGEERTIKLAPRVRVGTLLGIRSAVEAGLGIAVLPDFVVAEPLAQGTLRRLLPDLALAPIRVAALHRTEDRKSPRLRAVLAHLALTLPLSP